MRATLLHGPTGTVQWDCLYPAATVSVRLRGATLTGTGYAERLTVTQRPWTLPVRRLRWGRYTGSAHTAVWIDWNHDPTRRWIWLDGTLELAEPRHLRHTCCHAADLTNDQAAMTQRIDYIFSRDIGHPFAGVQGQVSLIGLGPQERLPGPGPRWPSDHAGLVATIQTTLPATTTAGR